MKRMLITLAIAGALLAAGPATAADFKLIVNPANTVAGLTRGEVEAFFLQKASKWPDGSKVVPVDQSGGRVYAEFCEEIFGKSAGAMKAYWQQKIFSGRAIPPISKKGDAAVAALVAAQPGAIGYVGAGANPAGVKVIPLR